MLLGFGLSILGPALPTLRTTTGASNGEISVLFTAVACGGFAGALIAGHLYDRGLGYKVFGGAIVCFVLVMLGIGLAPTVTLLTVCAVLLGFAGSSIDLGGNTMLLWHGGDNVSRNMNTLHLTFGIGAFLAPVLVGLSVSLTGGLALGFVPIVVAGMFLGWVAIMGPPAPIAKHVDDSGQAVGVPPTAAHMASLALYFLVYVGAEVGFGGWVFSYAEDQGWSAPVLAALFWGSFTCGRLAVAVIGGRATPAQVLYLSAAVALLGSTLMLVGRQSVWLVSAGIALVGIGVAPQFPTMLLFAERRIQTSGRSMSVIFGAAAAGSAIFPWLMGQVIDVETTSILPVLAFGLMTATMACTVLVAVILPTPNAR